MATIERMVEIHAEMKAWRRDLHAHPETAFEERRTADLVARKLAQFGIEVHRGLATTGVVGTLKVGTGNGAIGLRADMDALHIHERNEFGHRSTHAGKMHACGHDGHTAMLLGAAKYLAEARNFDGTVQFIFQPAEESEGGAGVMVEQGLFEKFPVDAVYGMHNMPGLGVGRFAVRPGAMLASFDVFEIVVAGKGSHAAMPHQGVDAVLVAANIVSGLQSIVSRGLDALESLVVSVTQIHGGDTWNVIPDTVALRGTVRAFSETARHDAEAAIARIAEGMCRAAGATMELSCERRYPPTVNSAAEAAIAGDAAALVVGEEGVARDAAPIMGSEDFAFMLQARPGSHMFIGNGEGGVGGCVLHNPRYDFNDAILPIGASYWARLVESRLAT